MRPNAKFDRAMFAALFVVAISWFGMATLVVHLGPWQQRIHFYDLLAVINDPAQRLVGINEPHPFLTYGFGLVCCAALFVPIAAFRTQHKEARLGCLAPLALMVITGAILYWNTSAEYFHPGDASVWGLLAQIAQSAVSGASRAFARRVSIGAGAYLGIVASAYLAFRAVSGFREAPDVAPSSGAAGDANAGTRQIEP